jgi:hypothetical protein
MTLMRDAILCDNPYFDLSVVTDLASFLKWGSDGPPYRDEDGRYLDSNGPKVPLNAARERARMQYPELKGFRLPDYINDRSVGAEFLEKIARENFGMEDGNTNFWIEFWWKKDFVYPKK